MRRNVCFLFCAAALSVMMGASSVAEARDWDDDDVDPVRLYGGLWLGFGGDAELDGDGTFGGDLETTVGGQFGLDAIASRHFSLGGEARFGAIKWRAGDRSKLIDLDFKPRLRFPLRGSPVELYVAVPVGLTIPRLAEIDDGNADGKVGWNLGAGGGINLWLTDSFALNAEPMWLMHRFKLDGPPDGDFTLKQFSLFLNAVIAL